jgi:hypothetical protein
VLSWLRARLGDIVLPSGSVAYYALLAVLEGTDVLDELQGIGYSERKVEAAEFVANIEPVEYVPSNEPAWKAMRWILGLAQYTRVVDWCIDEVPALAGGDHWVNVPCSNDRYLCVLFPDDMVAEMHVKMGKLETLPPSDKAHYEQVGWAELYKTVQARNPKLPAINPYLTLE